MEPNEDDPLYEVKRLDDFLDGKIQMTPYFELEKRGSAPPMIDGLSDEDVTRELTNLVWGLADLQIFVSDMDHLDDRAAYEALLEFCDAPGMFFPGSKSSACHWSPIGSCTEEDNEIYLRFYADEATRTMWMIEDGVTLPEKQPIPFPRPWIPVWNPTEE